MVPMSNSDMAYLYATFQKLNAMVKRAAAAGGAEFVDTYTPVDRAPRLRAAEPPLRGGPRHRVDQRRRPWPCRRTRTRPAQPRSSARRSPRCGSAARELSSSALLAEGLVEARPGTLEGALADLGELLALLPQRE